MSAGAWARALRSAALGALLAGSAPALAHELPEHALSARLGWSSTWVAELAYAHRLGEELRLVAGLELPPVLLPRAGRADLGLLARAHRGPWGVDLGASTGLGWAVDPLGGKWAWAVAVEARPGYRTRRASARLEIGWRTAALTAVKHSAAARDGFADRYPGAEEAPRWAVLALPAHRVRAGGGGSVRVSQRVGLDLAGGWEWAPQAQGVHMAPPLQPLPFYLLLGASYRW